MSRRPPRIAAVLTVGCLLTRVRQAAWWVLTSAVALSVVMLSCAVNMHTTLAGVNALSHNPLAVQPDAYGAAVTFPFTTNQNLTSLAGTCGTASGDSSTVNTSITGAGSQSGTATCSTLTSVAQAAVGYKAFYDGETYRLKSSTWGFAPRLGSPRHSARWTRAGPGCPATTGPPIAHRRQPGRARLVQVVRPVGRSTWTRRARPGRAEPARRDARFGVTPATGNCRAATVTSMSGSRGDGIQELREQASSAVVWWPDQTPFWSAVSPDAWSDRQASAVQHPPAPDAG